MSESSPTLWEQDFAKIREECLAGLKAGKNQFELIIIPTLGLTEDSLPEGFPAAVREFCKLSDSAPIIPQRLHLLPYFVSPEAKPTIGKTPKRFNGIVGWVNVDRPQSYQITVKINREEEPFVVVLRTFSRRDDDKKLLPGEVKYLEFMRFAGGLFRHHKFIETGNAEHAWMKFLVGSLWNHDRPKVSHLVATVDDLWGHSLWALDRLMNRVPEQPKRLRGRPAKNEAEDERIYRMWESGEFRGHKDLANELKRKLADVTRIIRRFQRRAKRHQQR